MNCNIEILNQELLQTINNLKPDCSNCFGLCCVALYFSVQDGFPTDKRAGIPCPNLEENYLCSVHKKLETLGLKGCIAYECFGAGQQISQVTFKGRSWKIDSESKNQMFEVFLIMRQLHEMCWYLTQALSYNLESSLCEEISQVLSETVCITKYPPQSLLEFDLEKHRGKINTLLRKTSKLVQSEIRCRKQIKNKTEKTSKMMKDFFGRDLRKKDFRCTDLDGACLIAANLEGADLSGTNFIGADFRDANIKGANLSESIFLTQSQINVAKGNTNTKLPIMISMPKHWV